MRQQTELERMIALTRQAATLILLALATTSASAAEPFWPPIADPPTGQREPGRWVWAELVTPDVGLAAEFYGAVFGWTFETYGPKDDRKTYTQVSADGVPIGGMIFRLADKKTPGRDARWVGLMSVADVDAAAAAVAKGGGKTLFAPRTLGDRGRAALFTDPEGAVFGVINSSTGDPDDATGVDNRWLWIELWADDPAKMAAFYQPLGGYELVAGSVPGEDSGVRLVSAGAPRAGIMRKEAKVPSTWVPYIRVGSVADTVARALEAGGSVVRKPMEMHGTVIAMLLDPTGAPFAVAEWNKGKEVAQ
jgi:predicted enzyme related to lactoylglutathione lyase